MDEVVKPVKNEINPKQMKLVKYKEENRMKNTMHGQKRCSPRPALNCKFQRSQQFQALSDVPEALLCLPEQRNVNHSLKQTVDLCVCMDFFVASHPKEYPKAMPHFQTNSLPSFSKQSQTLAL